MRDRLYALVVTLLFCGAAISPAIPNAEGKRTDGFPLSWFPMFSGTRPAEERVNYVIAVGPDGARHPVKTRYWTAGGLSEGRNQLDAKIRAGEAEATAFCARIAKKLAKRTRGWESEVVEVRLVRGWYSRERYFADRDPTPLRERVYFTCPVERS